MTQKKTLSGQQFYYQAFCTTRSSSKCIKSAELLHRSRELQRTFTEPRADQLYQLDVRCLKEFPFFVVVVVIKLFSLQLFFF